MQWVRQHDSTIAAGGRRAVMLSYAVAGRKLECGGMTASSATARTSGARPRRPARLRYATLEARAAGVTRGVLGLFSIAPLRRAAAALVLLFSSCLDRASPPVAARNL